MRVGTERPYGKTGMTMQDWQQLAPELVEYKDLTTTQDGVYIGALLSHWPRPGSDGYPHVVGYGGNLYLEDGHTRVVRDLLRGHREGWVRVARMGGDEAA